MSEESQILVASGSGIQTVVPQLATPQIVYLDFDGAEASYVNRDLDIHIDNIVVEDSGFDSETISLIVATLNEQFGDDIVFTADIPQTDEYSTIYVGVTSAFDELGDFLGLAETIDSDNQIHDDNAFVFLNSTASTELVTSVIAHEIGHLIGKVKHDDDGINQFAFSSYYGELYVENGDILTGDFNISEYRWINVLTGGCISSASLIRATTVERGGQIVTVAVYDDLYVDGGVVADAYVFSGGEIVMESTAGGYAFAIQIFNGGRFDCRNGGYVNGVIAYPGAYVSLATNATYEGQLVLAGGDVNIYEYYYSDVEANDASNLNVHFLLDYLVPGDATYLGEIDWDDYNVFPGDLIWGDTYPSALMNSYLLDGATYYIEVTANTKPGLYLLADNVGYDLFDETFYIHIDTQDDVIPINVWESKYGYTLYLDKSLYFSNGYDYGCLGLYLEVESLSQVKLYDDDILVSMAKVMTGKNLEANGSNYMVVSSGGMASQTTVNSETELKVSSGGVASLATINSGGILNVDKAGVLEGEIILKGGKLASTGLIIANDAKIVFDLTQYQPDNDIMVDNLANLPDASFTISVSSTDVKEGKYLLAGGADGFKSDIAFTIDGGMCLAEEYAGQYTFNWKDQVELEDKCLTLNPGRYTGINYNGYNYVLTIENGNLYLNVKKNVETMVLWLDADDEILGKLLKNVLIDLIQETVYKTTNYNRCIVVHADSFKGQDYRYTLVCGSAPSEDMTTVEFASNNASSLKELINTVEKTHKAEDYTLLVDDHGAGVNGLCTDSQGGTEKFIMSVEAFAQSLSSSSVSSICFYACLMSSVEVMMALSKYTLDTELKSKLKYVIASAELVGIKDLNYRKLFSKYVNGNKIEQAYYELFDSNTVSLVDIQSIKQLTTYLDYLGKRILDVIDINDNKTWKKIVNAINKSFAYGGGNRIKNPSEYSGTDLGGVLQNLAALFEDKLIKSSIALAIEEISKIRQLKTKDDYGDTSGLSVYFPLSTTEKGFQVIKNVMPENWVRFIACIIDKTKLTSSSIWDFFTLKNTVQNDREQMILGAFSGEGTKYYDLFVDDVSTDFSFVLNNEGAQNDRIVLDILEGTEAIAWSLLDSDGESIINGDSLEIALSGLAAGTYVLSVTSETPAIFNLAFKADWSSSQDYIDDLYPNNAIDTAFEIDGMSLTGLLVSSSSQDWFAFEMETFPNVITISSEASEQMKVSVYDAEGALVSELERQPNGDYVFTTSGEGFICVESLSGEKICYNLVSDFDMSIIDNAMSLLGDSSMLRWWNVASDVFRRLEISTDNFESSISIDLTGNGLGLLNLPSNTYQWRLYIEELDNWLEGNEITAETPQTNQLLEAEEDGNADAFFVKPLDVWNDSYHAMHIGIGAWDGTGEGVLLAGKNKIEDVFAGSDDASILLLTDDDNGDALFIDDIYSAFPEGLDAQARIAKIDEIRAGAGDDVIDLTSQRFDYVGGGMTVKGGLGDDVIWANNGENTLFGDAGNDRIVGASGNDVIVGGSGDDSLHGGGGDDIFAFGGDWGNDNVEQLADGKVTLWFDSGSQDNWDASALTYRDGDKSVKVSGITAENITLKFGDNGSEQYGKLLESSAFDEFSSERIFESRNTRGMLA